MAEMKKEKLFRKFLMLCVFSLCLAGFSLSSTGGKAKAQDCCSDCDARYATCVNNCVFNPEPEDACFFFCEGALARCRNRCGCD
jgi:hypothetical protein